MSLISRNSPQRTRAKKEKETRVEVKAPTLGPVVKNIPKIDTVHQQIMLDEYSYKPESVGPIEPTQLNRSLEKEVVRITKDAFCLYDLSFFCEERLYNILWLPQSKQYIEIRQININAIQHRLEVYSEYSREVIIGSFKDRIHFYRGEVLVPEEFLNITGFMRKFLKIEKVHVLYETGEILIKDSEYCNFWLDKVSKFFEPNDIPIDRPAILDKDVCFNCNLKCVIRHRQQMIN